jgi:hypothetical protein
MRVSIEIENIDELRRCNGIDDIELHEDTGHLQVGDLVFLTFLSGSNLRRSIPWPRLATPTARPECSVYEPMPW